MASRATRHAVIDIGTVTCRMLVGDVVDGRVVCVAREYRVTNLGEGVDATGMLSPAAIQRVVDAVSHYVSMLSELAEPGSPAIGVTAIATSAARDAENSAELERALARLGVSLTVVPGEREAALSFAGAASEFFGERVVVVDIGGGSTEVIAGIGGHAPRFARSFNVGVVARRSVSSGLIRLYARRLSPRGRGLPPRWRTSSQRFLRKTRPVQPLPQCLRSRGAWLPLRARRRAS